jgi:hypothetical protein
MDLGNLPWYQSFRANTTNSLRIDSAALVYPLSFLPLHPIIVTLLGGVAFLLLVVPLMALSGAVRRQDMEALDGYFRSVRPVSSLFGIVLRYYRFFARS